MTVTYTAEVATCKKFGCFLKLLFRWRGSIYKLVWMDLVAFILLYYTLSFVYRFGMTHDQQQKFESVVSYFRSYSSLIPLSFVLGFFVQIVMQRWWEQYVNIPWPDPVAVFVSAHIHGQDDRARLMRRTIMRYVVLSQAMVFSMIAPKVKKRFPTLNSFVDAGLMLENEKFVFESMDESFPKTPKYWMPIVWGASIVTRARKEGLIRDDFAVKTIVDELNKFRGFCGTLLIYDFIPIPLVYTQVVTVAVYTFFLGCVLGMQWTRPTDTIDGLSRSINFYLPVFTTLQFFFYMGWLKVAESLINPFGEDDDDFEVNWMIDRNLQVSYLIVDEMHQEHPDLVKDQYWDEVFPSELPYDGDIKREEPPEPSTTKLGERLATMSNVRVDAPVSEFRALQDIQGPEARQELLKRMTLISNEHKLRTDSSIYSTAVASPESIISPVASRAVEGDQRVNIIEGDITTKTQPSSPRQRSEDVPHKVKILDGVYESTDSDPIESYKDSGGNRELTDQTDADDKDDFDRLKEERDRERAERQKLRFVQRLGDAAQLAVKRGSKTSEHSWEEMVEEEVEEEEDLTNQELK